MSCHGGTHFSCECQRELLQDAIDSLSEILAGINNYRETLPMYERGILTKHIHGVTHAVSVLRRARVSQSR